MMYHIYKIAVWNGSERKADIDCKIMTKDPLLSLYELHSQDLGVEMTKESKLTIKFIECPGLTVTSYSIGYVNIAKHKIIKHG